MESSSLESKIIAHLKKNQAAGIGDFTDISGLSRSYLYRILKKLIIEGKVLRRGATNQARYLLADNSAYHEEGWGHTLANKHLQEDLIFKQAKQEFLVPLKLPEKTVAILEYAFSEMLNNAIEHAHALKIKVSFSSIGRDIQFIVRDNGVGIFNNVMKKRKLNNELEAIQDIFKGKQTTMPATHSGQGIFFTSKIADRFVITSGRSQVTVDNLLPDLFIKPHRLHRGTEIVFTVGRRTNKKLSDIFNQFSNDDYEFDRTTILVKLFTMDTSFVSRSQARRLLAGLESFKFITLDFDKVESVGQGFADEIFRVFKGSHPHIQINYLNTRPEVEFMIKRV